MLVRLPPPLPIGTILNHRVVHMERIDAIDDYAANGTQKTFARKKGVAENLPFASQATKYFVYNLAHTAVPPLSRGGARMRILRGFDTVEAAREYAEDVHEHDKTTVLVGATRGRGARVNRTPAGGQSASVKLTT